MTLTNDLRNFAVRTMKTVLVSTCLFSFIAARAQDSFRLKTPVLLSGLATYDFTRSYGCSIATSVPFRCTQREGVDKGFAPKSCQTIDFISAELGMGRTPFLYSSVSLQAGIGIRIIKAGKHFSELSVNQGIFRTIYDGIVYQLNPDGVLKERTFFGRTFATTGFAFSQYWALNPRHTWYIQLEPSSWVQYPYNSFLRVHLSLQAGVSYHLRDISVHTRTKHPHSS